MSAESGTTTAEMADGLVIRCFQGADEAAVIALWRRCGLTRPWNDPARDVARKTRIADDLFLVAARDGVVLGTAMAGYDGHRGWINYLAVDPRWQRRGVAARLMQEAEARLRDRGCPKVNVQIRTDNAEARDFYQRIGYADDAVVSMGKRLIADD